MIEVVEIAPDVVTIDVATIVAATIGIIQALTPIALGLFAWLQWRQGRVIKELEVNTNHKFDILLNTTKKASKAEGVIEGTETERARTQSIDVTQIRG